MDFLRYLDSFVSSASLVLLFVIARRVGAWEAFEKATKEELGRFRLSLDELVKKVYELVGKSSVK